MIKCYCNDPCCQFHEYDLDEITDMEDTAGEEKYQAEKEETNNEKYES